MPLNIETSVARCGDTGDPKPPKPKYGSKCGSRLGQWEPKSDKSTAFSVPEISKERVSYLIDFGIDAKIAAIDLSMVKMKMQKPVSEEGIGWSSEKCEKIEKLYKCYLTLTKEHSNLPPSKDIDEMWHFHILDTRAYKNDCETTFGYYMHHFPYFGMRGEEDAKNLKSSGIKAQKLFKARFGISMHGHDSSNCDSPKCTAPVCAFEPGS